MSTPATLKRAKELKIFRIAITYWNIRV